MTIDQMQTEIEMVEEQEQPGFLGRLVRRAKRYAYAGIGVVAVTAEKASEFRHEKVEKGIDQLAERGHEVKERRVKSAGEMAEMTKGMAVGATQQVGQLAKGTAGAVTTKARQRMGIASAADVDAVTGRLDELNQQLDEVIAPSA